jgi:hypothetical protein
VSDTVINKKTDLVVSHKIGFFIKMAGWWGVKSKNATPISTDTCETLLKAFCWNYFIPRPTDQYFATLSKRYSIKKAGKCEVTLGF